MIPDEAQNIKNADSTAWWPGAAGGDHRIALPGDSAENRLAELWSLFDFYMPGFLAPPRGSTSATSSRSRRRATPNLRDRPKKRIHLFILRRLTRK